MDAKKFMQNYLCIKGDKYRHYNMLVLAGSSLLDSQPQLFPFVCCLVVIGLIHFSEFPL